MPKLRSARENAPEPKSQCHAFCMNQTNKVAIQLNMEPNSSLTSTDLSENSRENGVKKERDHVGMAKRLGNDERRERTRIRERGSRTFRR